MTMTLIKQQKTTTEKKLKPKKSSFAYSPVVEELMAFCPKCKTPETVRLYDSVLSPTRKFSQEDGKLYHDCGANEPCRVYRVI